MKDCRSIFMTGKRHAGKTSLILKKTGAITESACGFIVQRLIEDNVCRAFCVRSIEPGITPYATFEKCTSGIFITRTREGWETDIDVFIESALASLHGYESKKLVILDEIGGIELFSDRFIGYLYKVFESGLPCIGVIKSDESIIAMEKAIHTLQGIQKRRNELLNDIENNHNGKILTLTETTRPNVESTIDLFLTSVFNAIK